MTTYSALVEQTEERRRDFFKLVFGDETGIVCIAYKSHLDKSFDERFFHYPAQLDDMCADIDKMAQTLTHVYFCPQLLGAKRRKKDDVIKCTSLWADLDECSPTLLQVPASIVIQSSAGRWQALWRLDEAIDPLEAESICMRIAYFHANSGADRSGWDLTQLLRVPYTPNYKYGDIKDAPIVSVFSTSLALYRPSDFDVYPMYKALEHTTNPMPAIGDMPKEDPIEILQKYRRVLNPQAFGLFDLPPDEGEDWSAAQWKLGNLCCEAGMAMEEALAVLWASKCNKYKRDGRPMSSMWLEVQKVYLKEAEFHNLVPTPTSVIPEIISEDEVNIVLGRETFIERYIKWASSLTDSATQYHQAGAFIILSAIISGAVKLPTSFGTVVPNMWFMLVADTTLTRKSTAMDISLDLLYEVNPDAIMGTDGSPEGVLSALKDRAGKPSIYHRDEFTGLLEAMANKDYMAGMAEHFTKLYDGKTLKRLLRKEEIIIKDPVFIIFAGGTKKKMMNILNEEHVNSGFVPRFIFITAKADPTRVKPIGPPVQINKQEKELILEELMNIDINYNTPRMIAMPGAKNSAAVKPEFLAELTEEAWDRYNQLETTLTNAAIDTGLPHLTPVYDRLAKSTLKAAILIAASRQGETGDIVVELADILHAIYYCKHWHVYASEIVNGVGKSQDERTIDQIQEVVLATGTSGMSRSELMRMFKLDSRRAELILSTMVQRRILYASHVNGQPRYVGNK
jgi:hypothetical protein